MFCWLINSSTFSTVVLVSVFVASFTEVGCFGTIGGVGGTGCAGSTDCVSVVATVFAVLWLQPNCKKTIVINKNLISFYLMV